MWFWLWFYLCPVLQEGRAQAVLMQSAEEIPAVPLLTSPSFSVQFLIKFPIASDIFVYLFRPREDFSSVLSSKGFLSDLSSIFRTQWSRKTMLVFGGWGKGGKLVVVSRWSGPDWSNLLPQGGSKGLASAGKAACTPCAKKSPTQTHSSFGSAQGMAITAPGRK